MDNTIHHDTNLEQHWWRTIDLLTCVGQACIVLNLDKFQFVERSINFAGFRVSDSLIEPLPKYLDAIREFPSLTSTTEIRSWFGLANQVTNYAQLRNIMAPFKPFLSAHCQFLWSPELEAAFHTSKAAIVEAIRHGVEIFDMQRRPASVPTGPVAASATSSSNNTVTAPRASQTVAPGDGGSPWQAPTSSRHQSNVTL